jgi:hypothetical protein
MRRTAVTVPDLPIGKLPEVRRPLRGVRPAGDA